MNAHSLHLNVMRHVRKSLAQSRRVAGVSLPGGALQWGEGGSGVRARLDITFNRFYIQRTTLMWNSRVDDVAMDIGSENKRTPNFEGEEGL